MRKSVSEQCAVPTPVLPVEGLRIPRLKKYVSDGEGYVTVEIESRSESTDMCLQLKRLCRSWENSGTLDNLNETDWWSAAI